jgi:hypothetical protein
MAVRDMMHQLPDRPAPFAVRRVELVLVEVEERVLNTQRKHPEVIHPLVEQLFRVIGRLKFSNWIPRVYCGC